MGERYQEKAGRLAKEAEAAQAAEDAKAAPVKAAAAKPKPKKEFLGQKLASKK